MLKLIINKQAFKALTIPSYHPHRPISTTPRRNIDGNSHHDDGHHHDSGGECAASESHPHATWKDFSQLDKDVSNIKLKLDYLKTGLSETKAEIKDLGNMTEKKFDKIDGKFDKTDSKIDRIFYGVISGLVGFILKGGFDYYQATKK